MRFLYKICRAENPDALYSGFLAFAPEVLHFDEVQDAALDSMKLFVAEASDVNKEVNGVTRLWAAAEHGQHKAVHEILSLRSSPLQSPGIATGICACVSPLITYFYNQDSRGDLGVFYTFFYNHVSAGILNHFWIQVQVTVSELKRPLCNIKPSYKQGG
jgi:hypothetical protein